MLLPPSVSEFLQNVDTFQTAWSYFPEDSNINLYITCAYANAHRKDNPRNSFYIFRQQGNYCTFKTYCMISVIFYTKCHLFHDFIFCYSNNTFFINHALKFKHKPGYLKVNTIIRTSTLFIG